MRTPDGFVAQISLRSVFPLSLTDLAYSLCFGNAKCCETVEYGGTYLDLRDLPIKVMRGEALTKQFDAMHRCFDAASEVIPSYCRRNARPRYFEDRTASFRALAPGVLGLHNFAFLCGGMTAWALRAAIAS